MKVLADTRTLVDEGVISSAQAEEIQRRARDEMVSFVINIVLFSGIIAVIGGTAAFLDDPREFCLLGAVVTAGAAVFLLRGPQVLTLLVNAGAVIGSVMFIGGGMAWIAPDLSDAAALVLPGAVIAGLSLAGWVKGPRGLRFLMGWLAFLGLCLHLLGLVGAEAPIAPLWLLYYYAAGMLIAAGIVLDVRLLTVLSLIPLATALSSQTFYVTATYGVVIRESTLTILQMAVVVAGCLWAGANLSERYQRHTRVLGQLSFVWMNIAFWIGSLWGDTVGEGLWRPRRSDVPADATDPEAAYRAMLDAFNANATKISADAFSLAWAVLLAAAAVWAASRGRRKVFNIAVTFGTIHLYTQYFERFHASPGTFIIGGLLAIALAWGVWMANRWLKEKQPPGTDG
ncbi:hypothetical protein [Shimia biformata]|uniref:hypothetical protein n=1 Tax=Shimia biformata TaxID=1294299 RepID=UPI001951F0F7|nr:hypothetical protein [Shimia biformata]